MEKFDELHRKGYLKGLLEKEKADLKKTKGDYTTSIVLCAGVTTSFSVVGGANYGDPSFPFLLMFAGMSGAFTLGSWYFGSKKIKQHKKKISELEEKLKCL